MEKNLEYAMQIKRSMNKARHLTWTAYDEAARELDKGRKEENNEIQGRIRYYYYCYLMV